MQESDTPTSHAPDVNRPDPAGQIHTLLLMAGTGIGLYFCYRMMEPFAAAFAWALALAVLFAPLHRWIESKWRWPDAAATASVFVIALIGMALAGFVVDRVVSEVVRGAELTRTAIETGQWRRAFSVHPMIAPVGGWIERELDLPGILQTALAWFTDKAATFVRGSLVQLTGIVLVLYMLYYFLRDRRLALASLRALSPLSQADMSRMLAAVFDTVHATVYGTLAVAAVQGMLGGLMFWWLGLPAPLLWGLVMGLLAVVPVLGAFVIWIPAVIFLLLDGSGGKALVLAVWGGVVVGGIDNVLYPMLVGRRLKMHTAVAFVSIVGGLLVFGPSGLILGPVIFTMTRVLLEIWGDRNAAAEA